MDSTMDSSASTNSDRSSNMSNSPPPAIKTPVTPTNNNNNNSCSINNGSAVSPMSLSRLQESPISGHHGLPQPSPPPVSTPSSIASIANRLGQSMHPLPPQTLGILNSMGMHPSHLELMAMSHPHVPPRSYNSPPPISTSDPTANDCKLVEYRGQKVAAFIIQNETMLCLPQAFELFLKHLVGGLHTVYTKLKRLDIIPLVCNVEQVRILRGLGAIQPGVNRCKLLSCKDFDTLYRDCTTARCLMSHKATESTCLRLCSSRPGRPPKRAAPVGLSLAASHLSHQLKKHRLENGDYPVAYENGHLSDAPRLEKSPLLANGYNQPPTHLNHMQFLPMNHPAHTAILPPGLSHYPGLPRPDSAIMKAQGIPGMEAFTRSGILENCRAAYEDVLKHLERLREDRGETDRVLALDQKTRDLSSQNGSSAEHSPVLNLSKSGGDHSGSEAGHTSPENEDEDDNASDVDDEDDKEQDLSDNAELGGGSAPGSDSPHALNYSNMGASVPAEAGVSSTETLLRNIQGLLKVAADNARQQERQINYEKAELKMDVLREREEKVSIERQLVDEQKSRDTFQKRWRKERKERKKLQAKLEAEFKRRGQLLDALKTAGAPLEALRILTESASDRVPKSETGSDRERESTPNSYISPACKPSSGDRDPPLERERDREREKQWSYAGLDLVSSGALWQNYSESLAQELEQERKKAQQQQQQQQQHVERDVKSPLQDSRSGYYKNSVLFSSAT